MKDIPTKAYDAILAAVCKELHVERKTIMAVSRDEKVMFACGLYLQLVSDKGLDEQEAIVLINKSRRTIPIYASITERELKNNIQSYDHYKRCCKKLGIRGTVAEYSHAVWQYTDAYIRRKIGRLPKKNVYTVQEEIAMVRAMLSAASFMRNYGKGLQPLKDGYALSRKLRQ